MVTELFKRIVGSAPGYEQRPSMTPQKPMRATSNFTTIPVIALKLDTRGQLSSLGFNRARIY